LLRKSVIQQGLPMTLESHEGNPHPWRGLPPLADAPREPYINKQQGA
jgi:hypothetical protein